MVGENGAGSPRSVFSANPLPQGVVLPTTAAATAFGYTNAKPLVSALSPVTSQPAARASSSSAAAASSPLPAFVGPSPADAVADKGQVCEIASSVTRQTPHTAAGSPALPAAALHAAIAGPIPTAAATATATTDRVSARSVMSYASTNARTLQEQPAKTSAGSAAEAPETASTGVCVAVSATPHSTATGALLPLAATAAAGEGNSTGLASSSDERGTTAAAAIPVATATAAAPKSATDELNSTDQNFTGQPLESSSRDKENSGAVTSTTEEASRPASVENGKAIGSMTERGAALFSPEGAPAIVLPSLARTVEEMLVEAGVQRRDERVVHALVDLFQRETLTLLADAAELVDLRNSTAADATESDQITAATPAKEGGESSTFHNFVSLSTNVPRGGSGNFRIEEEDARVAVQEYMEKMIVQQNISSDRARLENLSNFRAVGDTAGAEHLLHRQPFQSAEASGNTKSFYGGATGIAFDSFNVQNSAAGPLLGVEESNVSSNRSAAAAVGAAAGGQSGAAFMRSNPLGRAPNGLPPYLPEDVSLYTIMPRWTVRAAEKPAEAETSRK